MEFKSYKNKVIDNKKQWSIFDQAEVDLFGWDQAISTGSPKLIITEGEEDAVALYQMIRDNNIGTEYEDRHPAVVSLSHGASSAVRDLSLHAPKIRQYSKK